MKYKINLNDYTYLTISMNEDGFFEMSTNHAEIEQLITTVNRNNRLYIGLVNDVFAYIDLETKEVKYLGRSFTAAEIRNAYETIMSRTAPTSETRKVFEENKEEISLPALRTELHTHFLEMLTGKEFLKIVGNCGIKIPIRNNKILGTIYKGEKISDFLSIDVNKENIDYLASQLSIGLDGQKDFGELSEVSCRRTNLITLAAQSLARENGREADTDTVAEYRAILYILMLKKSLSSLYEHKIEYVEFSYSTEKTIIKMQDYYKKHRDEFPKINFNILFSMSRNILKDSVVVKNLNSFERLVNDGYVKGFDLMGEEHGLTKADRDNLNDPKTFVSIMNRVLGIMNGKKDMVLRLHAGENANSRFNPLYSLAIIDGLVEKFGYKPPQIRIGHGLHFPNEALFNEKYAYLLKKYDVIVEINATSNYTLSNIDQMSNIPYKWYVEHQIPIVLATDGAGMYLTDAFQEQLNGLLFGGKETVDKVVDTESSLLR